MTHEDMKKFAELYRAALLQDIIPFWMGHSLDRMHGGYLTCLDRDGTVATESVGIAVTAGNRPVPVRLAATRADSHNPFLYHKTTHRPWYAGVREQYPECLDVIFLNERGEVTEGANHNLVVQVDGSLVTPPLASGLLPGVFRAELLAAGVISERVVTMTELACAGEVWLINSVRKWRRAYLV